MKKENKFRKFFTLNPRHEGGFTLVELVVVIAILAILAGVGSAGYAGYIKAANKGNDKVLVGNIMRALETGANTTMFKPDDSMMVGVTSYPVGLIVLTTEGTTVRTSAASVKDTGECEFVTTDVAVKTPISIAVSCTVCSKSGTETAYKVETKTITFCATHSKNISLLNAQETYATGYEYEYTGWQSHKASRDHDIKITAT